LFVAVELSRQYTFASELVDGGDANVQLTREFLRRQEAPCAQSVKAALETIRLTNMTDTFAREGLTFPVAMPERVELYGRLPVRAGLEQLIELLDHLRKSFTHESHGLGSLNAEGGSPSASEPNVQGDLGGFYQGHVLNEQRQHLLALERLCAWIAPYSREVCREREDALPGLVAQQSLVCLALLLVLLLECIESA